MTASSVTSPTSKGCVIEDRALVGSGAIVLHQATVHSGATVGAGAVVRNRMDVPANALAVGVPAVIKLDASGEDGHRRERRLLRRQRPLVQEGTARALGVRELDEAFERDAGATFGHARRGQLEALAQVSSRDRRQ